jgi:hypothetical protein
MSAAGFDVSHQARQSGLKTMLALSRQNNQECHILYKTEDTLFMLLMLLQAYTSRASTSAGCKCVPDNSVQLNDGGDNGGMLSLAYRVPCW